MNQQTIDQQTAGIKKMDAEFDIIFGRHFDDEPVPISLLRASAKMIVCSYPDNCHRQDAIDNFLTAAENLRLAEADNV